MPSLSVISDNEKKVLSFGFQNYPKKRDDYILPSATDWLQIKQANDFISSNSKYWWRIHDKIYDLTSFNHPGGRVFIDMTRNTDITELYESNHVHINKAEQLLSKYFIRNCDPVKEPRFVSPYFCTFHKDGFYCTVRDRVSAFFSSEEGQQLRNKKFNSYFQRTEFIHDVLLVLFIMGWIPIVTYNPGSDSSIFYDIKILPFILGTGFVFGLLAICSHNFYHQRETPYNTSLSKNSTCVLTSYNWRQYSFDLTGNSSYEWKITHVYSHHIFPNTILDYEIIAFEPLLQYLPYSFKSVYTYLQRDKLFLDHNNKSNSAWNLIFGIICQVLYTFASLLFFFGVFPLVMIVPAVKRYVMLLLGRRSFRWEFLLPILLFAILCVARTLAVHQIVEELTTTTLLSSARFLALPYIVINMLCGLSFLHISLAAGHHHTASWHAGDNKPAEVLKLKDSKGYKGPHPLEIDFGIFQIIAVSARPEMDSSTLFSSMSFGQHILHHLFPTVDQSMLFALQGILYETCKEFQIADLLPHLDPNYQKKDEKKPVGTSSRIISSWEAWKGMVTEIFRSEGHPDNYPEQILTAYHQYMQSKKTK